MEGGADREYDVQVNHFHHEHVRALVLVSPSNFLPHKNLYEPIPLSLMDEFLFKREERGWKFVYDSECILEVMYWFLIF
jgi:hypothetical protein